jgi:hypothetical protein
MAALMNCTPHESVAASAHDEGLVLMDVATGRLFASNRTGARIWEGLTQQQSVPAIAAALSDHYGISLDAARACVTTFLAQLVEHRLVEVRP